jgi:hypothetical protein
LVLADDLKHFQIGDITGGLDDIAKYPRHEGETAFPELPRLKQAIIERKLVREAEEVRKAEAEETEYAKAHPEEFISARDFWGSPEVRAILAKSPKLERERAEDTAQKESVA